VRRMEVCYSNSLGSGRLGNLNIRPPGAMNEILLGVLAESCKTVPPCNSLH
jgi:hypothetical protein